MDHPLHPAVAQLAGVVAAKPAEGVKQYEAIQHKIQGLRSLDSASRHAVEAIRSVGAPQDQTELFAKVIKNLKGAGRQQQVGYRMLLGALWDELAFHGRRGALTPEQRTLQQDLRQFIYPDTSHASGT